MSEADNIGSGDPGQDAGIGGGEGGASSERGGERRVHYESLEQADAAARDFQSRYDRAQAENERLQAELAGYRSIGPADAVRTFVERQLPVTQRPDYSDYVSGRLGRPSSGESEGMDEYATEEERRLASLEERIQSAENTYREELMKRDLRLAEMTFQGHTAKLDRIYGADVWRKYEPQMMQQVQMFARTSGSEATAMPFKTVEDILWMCVPEPDRPAFRQKAAEAEARRIREAQAPFGTTVPGSERTGVIDETPPKTWAEAVRRGIRDGSARDRTAGGR